MNLNTFICTDVSMEYSCRPALGKQNEMEAMSLAGLSQGQLNIPCAIIKLYLWRDHREGGRPSIGQQSKRLQGGAMYLLLLWLSWVSHKCQKLFSRKNCKPRKLFCYGPKRSFGGTSLKEKRHYFEGSFFFCSLQQGMQLGLYLALCLLTAFLCQEKA